jgi:methionyl-tRNA formyltransferase
MYTSAWPILNNELVSGVTLHRIDQGIDTGDIIEQTEFAIGDLTTSRELYFKYMSYGLDLIKENLPAVLQGNFKSFPQTSNGASYYSTKSIDYKNLTIDLNKTAFEITLQLRAFSFVEYQIPTVYGRKIISWRISTERSSQKPGMVMREQNKGITISTIDFDLDLFY